MKKTLALVLTIALVLTALFTLVACSHEHVDKDLNYECDKCGIPMEEKVQVGEELHGEYDIKVWVSETVKKEGEGADAKIVDSVVDMTKRQIAKFVEANPGIKINATVEPQGEGDAASKVIADVATAPDMYGFAQDQLVRLVQAGALAAPGNKAQTYIRSINDAGAVAAATVGDRLYAYPMTSDNGYFLYYDKSVVTNPDSLEQIIADCEKAGKTFNFEVENAWYTASFFFATGCKSDWTVDSKGNYTDLDDTFNSANGLISMKGLQKLTKSSAYKNSSSEFADAGAIVTGVWNSQTAKTTYGDNLGVADLPSFTVDGKSYHLGSYSGNKLLGVKPQDDPKKGAVCQLLAQWLTSDECQMERFEVFGWGPSSKVSQLDEAVMADASLCALIEQNKYATPQPQIHGAWWDIAKKLGTESKAAQSDADLQEALDAYDEALAEVFNMSDDEKTAWSVIGSMTEWGNNADIPGDLPMTPNADKTVWTSEPITLTADDEWKVRQGKSWDVNFGADGALNGGNIKIGEAGTYVITLTLTYNEDGSVATANITWAKQ